MDDLEHAAALEQVMELERRLSDPAVRADRNELERLLHPDFEEIGSSGRVWTREATIQAARPEMLGASAVHVAPGVVLARYDTRRGDRTVHRSSWWLHDGTRWSVRFHQGTPSP